MTAEAGGTERPARRARPPRPPRRGTALPVLAGVLLLAAIGFLIWYFVFRSDGGANEAEEPAVVALAPARVDFGDADVGSRGGTQRVRLSNGGALPVGIADIRVRGKNRKSFAVTRATTCSRRAPLNEAESCVIAVRFQPKGRGERRASLRVRFVGDRPQVTARLHGNGMGEPEAVLETSRLGFGEVELQTQPATERTTLRNPGNVPLRIESVAIEGPAADSFRIVQGEKGCTPRRRVRPGGSCTLTVRFRPTDLGERAAALVVRHDAAGSPSEVGLQGTGLGRPKARLSPRSLTFGRVRVRARSDAKTVTLENTGTDTLTVAAIALDGANPRNFRIAGSGTCEAGGTLEPGATCTVDVRFRPSRRGRREATLAIEADTRAGRHTVELSGTGMRRGQRP